MSVIRVTKNPKWEEVNKRVLEFIKDDIHIQSYSVDVDPPGVYYLTVEIAMSPKPISWEQYAWLLDGEVEDD
jgi:hypothetical protein